MLAFLFLATLSFAQTSTTITTTAASAVSPVSSVSLATGSPVSSLSPASTTTTTGVDVCTTASGAAISIIFPLSGNAYNVGSTLFIAWKVVGIPDPVFLKGNLSFEIANAANPNVVQAVPGGALVFDQQPIVGALNATVPVPNIPSGTHYTIKSTYKDVTSIKNCFSPQFTVNGVAATSVTAATANGGNGAAASSAASKPTSGVEKKGGVSVWIGVVFALLLL